MGPRDYVMGVGASGVGMPPVPILEAGWGISAGSSEFVGSGECVKYADNQEYSIAGVWKR